MAERDQNHFLLEIGSEEIPAGMIDDACQQLRERIGGRLQELGISFDAPPRTYNSPRRLAIQLTGLADRQPDRQEIISGPPRSIAYDAQGKPTRAAEGFARKIGVDLSQLSLSETDRGSYLCHQSTILGQPLPKLLTQVAGEAIRGLQWPKSMYWRESRFRFIRPIRWIVALWNDQVVPLEVEGIRAGRSSSGHRFLGQAVVELPSADSYLESLRRNGVIAEPEERRRLIEEGLRSACQEGTSVIADLPLLAEVIHLNEFPTVIRGGFDPKYLKIPREVLTTVLRHHQKYFSVRDSKGVLEPSFVTVLNSGGDPKGQIRSGHERVLRARLEDAEFFWSTDSKRPLQERVPGLDQVVFYERLGSYGDKTRRLRRLCAEISREWPGLEPQKLDRAAQLCKADLITGMVGEFPELQGIMGGLYARQEGEPEEVWRAVYEHYRPGSLEEPVPTTLTGAVLSLADKMDTLVGCFGIGIVPSGSRDPFALRRQGQGIVKILLELGRMVPAGLPLPWFVETSQRGHARPEDPEEARQAVLDFLRGRIRSVLERAGLEYDVLNAVLAVEIERVSDCLEKAKALTSLRGQADFEVLAAAFKRIRNILGAQDLSQIPLREELFEESEERRLYEAFAQTAPRVESFLQQGSYGEALALMAGLRQPVDEFFEAVLVMAEAPEVRNNRLRLLEDLSGMFLRFADISEIVQRD